MLRAIKKILVFIISVILVCSIISAIILTSTKNMLTKESIADYVNDSNVLELKSGKLLNINNDKLNEESTIKEVVVLLASDANIPKEVIDDLIESNELSIVLGDLIKGIIDYAVIGEEKPTISSDTVNNLTKRANDSLEKHIDLLMEKEELDSNIKDYIDSINDMVPERSNIVTDSNRLNTVKDIITFNTIYLYVTIVICTILIGIILMSFYKPLKYLGITTLISGIIFTIIGCLEWPIYNLMKGSVKNFEGLFHPLLKKVLFVCFKQGVIYSVIGLFLIILFIVINRFYNNKKILEETRRINIEDIKL